VSQGESWLLVTLSSPLTDGLLEPELFQGLPQPELVPALPKPELVEGLAYDVLMLAP
jgi:hypothetical protein